jgi:hypothetical protein
MKEAINIPENNKDRSKLSRVVAVFIRMLIKNKIDIQKYQENLD